jgi:hypothetical protein
MAEALVLLGRLVTFDPARPDIEDGAAYIGANERAAAVQSRTDPAPGGFGSARRVETKGCIYPGPIDLHSHVVYNILPLWSRPGTTEPFVNRKGLAEARRLRGDGLRPGERARGAGGEGTPEVLRGQGGDRRHDRDPGVGQDGLPLRGLAGARCR